MRKKILIVDDEIDLFGFLKDSLEDYGYNVVTVETGENAVKLAEKDFFDIILMDYNLPGINGLEAFRRIKKISPLSIVIMMTAAAPESALNEAIMEGTYAIMHKPFKVEGMMEKINEAVNKPTCIIIDDRFTDREVIKDLLEQKGCKCVSIADGQSAIEMLKHERPDLIFLDITMPNMDGFKILENIKAAYPDLDVIMMTAYPKTEYLKVAVEMGALTCLAKPLQMNKVLDIIETIKHRTPPAESGEKVPAILLIEDDAALNKSLAAILQDDGYAVTTAGTGRQAIEESKKKFYNLAIVDFKLPDISGIEVIKKLKDVNSEIAVILMTAHESMDMAVDAIKERVLELLIKPVDPGVLLQSIRKGLRRKES
jgi:DNA-binding NtrC family response regulator